MSSQEPFAVEVAAPSRGLKGASYSAQFEDGNLVLSSNQPSLVLAAGTQAISEQDSVIRTRLEGDEITLTIVESGCDTTLLAADAASYLAGRRAEFQVDNYRWPRILTFLSLSPVAIPAMLFAALQQPAMQAPINLWGFLWLDIVYAISAAGFMLAMGLILLGFQIARVKSVTTAIKAMLILLVGAVSIGACVGGLAWWHKVRIDQANQKGGVR